jgi:hypothetical protein
LAMEVTKCYHTTLLKRQKWKRQAQAKHQLLISAYEADEAITIEFKRSMWFTRGWTLQELLALSILLFLNYKWNPFGTQGNLADHIASENSFLRKYSSRTRKLKLVVRRKRCRGLRTERPAGLKTSRIVCLVYSMSTCHCCTERDR